MSGHFIVYAARQGARNFFDGISDPTFFKTINKILDDGFYLGYKDPRHGEVFKFESLKNFVVHEEGLGIPDWLPFMKALKAQDEGSEAKVLYWRMVRLDESLDPLVGSATQAAAAKPLIEPDQGGPGRGHKSHDNIMAFQGTSRDYLLRRIARDQPNLLDEIGPTKRFKSARAAAIEAGIITPFPSLQLKDPAPTAQKLLAKKGAQWCRELLDELSELCLSD